MKTLLAVLVLMGISGAASAKSSCTDKPKSDWMKVEDFKKMATDNGYTIKKFKTPGSCYEIYGTDKDGKSVEVYFNPVDGSVVKSK